ncbi:MAG TPA: membrane protein insertion efficiency factor YidD [Patescibacteria group bacterium]|nr:membrane protein insertion efficiency factor YidD [Patescibacteria group bacterium]
MIKKIVIGSIRIYQHTLSPDHGVMPHAPYIGCKYYPSCSEYTLRSVQSRGVIIGLLLGVWRVLRCNPFSRGGVDMPPTHQQHILSK